MPTPQTRDEIAKDTPPEVLAQIEEIGTQGKALGAALDPELVNAVGFTHFDTGASHDNVVTVLMARPDLHLLASQTLVRIKSGEDRRVYLGVVVKGPFSEPDAVPPNSTMAVGVVIQGKKLNYTFDYHGRAEVEILGEEVQGALVPPRYRPRPKSPVYLLAQEESAKFLGVGGDLCFGTVVGYDDMEARISARDKSVLPRHTGVIGTTGGGKSTTVATLIHRAQAAGIATIVFDVEGEYTHVDQPTDHKTMLEALTRRKQKPQGVADLHIHHLVGRETTNPGHRNLRKFSLKFSNLSPHAIAEILEMTDAQEERFMTAYDAAKYLLWDFKILNEDDRKALLELDELTTGVPKLTIHHVVDAVSAYWFTLSDVGKSDGGPGHPHFHSEFRTAPEQVMRRVRANPGKHEASWRTLLGKIRRLQRLNIFDVESARGVDYGAMLTPGRVSVIDLSDTDSPQLNNLAIADILRGIQEKQEERYQEASKRNESPVPALIIIEEAHEFLSESRIKKMPVLFDTVARIAKRGRKRWLGLVFVTQLPQHLPNEVLGLLNNFIIHKITDSGVLSRMQRTVGSIDESLWLRVPRLAPGQALASFSGFTRPLMVAIDPAPCKRLLVE